MTDITLALATLNVAVPPVLISTPTPITPTPAGETTEYALYACTKHGSGGTRTLIATALVQTVQWPAVNAPMISTFQVPWDDPNVGLLPTSVVPFVADSGLNHEVQIYRNNHLIFWGPIVARQGNSKDRVWQFIANDPLWYLQSRFFGEANRLNYLTNGSFEDDPASPVGWTISSGADLTTSIDAVNFLIGSQSLFMQDETPGDDAYIGQRLIIHAGPAGLAITATAWVFVQSQEPNPFSPNLGDRGLEIIRRNFGETILESASDPVDTTTAKQQWVRLSAAVLVPPNQTQFVDILLHIGIGSRNYDAVTATTEESLSLIPLNSADGSGWDQIDVAKMIVRYASGAYPLGTPYTKSNLNIAVAGSASGIKKSKTYQFFDHQQVYQGGAGSGALDEFFAASDGFDCRMEFTPNTRTLKFYYPSVGQTWDTDLFLYRRVVTDGVVSGETRRVVGHTWSETIDGAADNITEIGGWGSGSGREEGGAFTDTFGDLTLELVEAAPTGATLDLLASVATARGNQLGQVQSTPTLTIVELRDPDTGDVVVPLIGALIPGDLVPLTIDDGPIQVAETIRVVSVSLDTTTESLTVGIQLNTPDDTHFVPRARPTQSFDYRRHGQRLYELERRILTIAPVFLGED